MVSGVVPISDPGLSYLSTLTASQGYQVLAKNLNRNVNQFEDQASVQSNIQYFEKTVGSIKSVNDFVNNTKLVNFVLSAFGLDSEQPYQGLVRKVLTQDPSSPKSLVNQLTDPRFKQLATAFDFFDNGLSRLQASGLGSPTTATSTEPGATTTPQTGISLGIAVNKNQYLIVQKPDGTTAYTQSGYFTLNKDNELALPDGSTLQPPVIYPANTTGVTIDASGSVYAQVKGKTEPTSVGVLEVATFAKPAQLAKDKSGYYEATTGSGAAQNTFAQAKTVSVFSNTIQNLVNSFVTNEFEVAVGKYNTGVREALYFQRNVAGDAKAAKGNATLGADYLLGDAVIRDVVITALHQPAQIAYQSLSRQEDIVKSGISLSQEQNPKYITQFTQRFLTLYDTTHTPTGASNSNSAALQILSAFNSGSSDSSGGSSIINISA